MYEVEVDEQEQSDGQGEEEQQEQLEDRHCVEVSREVRDSGAESESSQLVQWQRAGALPRCRTMRQRE